MRRPRQNKPRHRRYWRYLWRYCRCGYRWRCPDSVERVPMPYEPTVLPPARGSLGQPVPMPSDVPMPPGRVRPTNRRASGYASGRNGKTAAPADRMRRVERVQG
ncbi:hypothetical protein ACFP2T_06815 [Plantactinospora solaniradicis]|uniref:Uncharacterized protein n=1 Tax=Plantactinospora solaniradicis TaxID=1723736 RepID=A0ABW1K3S0_9ACTN